jgi:hypothetical protein
MRFLIFRSLRKPAGQAGWGEVLPGSVLQGNVPGRKWVTVGIDSPLVRDIGVK